MLSNISNTIWFHGTVISTLDDFAWEPRIWFTIAWISLKLLILSTMVGGRACISRPANLLLWCKRIIYFFFFQFFARIQLDSRTNSFFSVLYSTLFFFLGFRHIFLFPCMLLAQFLRTVYEFYRVDVVLRHLCFVVDFSAGK